MIDRECEWLEADGLGAYASGTVGLVRTRRYHALLMTATVVPVVRMVLVNGIEAWLARAGQIVPLTSQRYSPDVVQPDGARLVRDFSAQPWPAWEYALPDGAALRFELFVAPDACETVLRWVAPAGYGWQLCVRPLLSGREQNALHQENAGFEFAAMTSGGNVSWRPYPGVPAMTALTNGRYQHAPQWYRQFLYTEERDRGLDDTEDLASPGVFGFDLAAGPAVMVLRAGDGLALRAADYAAALAVSERARRAQAGGLEGVVAASYLVDRGSGRTVLAGFPWFTDWGRDSFIALRGLALATGRLDQARAILLEWAGQVSEGMLPNRFPDDGGAPEFNSVDASLWFIVAVHDFLAIAPADAAVEHALAAACQAILAGYRAGTRFGIRMEPDGLIAAGVPGVQLTWMDAKVDDWVVTPRIGKPVEVQALWINGLRIAARWSADWAGLAALAEASFAARFPRPDGGLWDVVDADHVAGRCDPALRPNQIFAVGGLPYALLTGSAGRAVVDLVEQKLLTPLGLRTLAPEDPAYCPVYRGDRRQRDGAYHQGTAWPWLMGAFVDAWLAVRGRSAAARATAAARFLPPLEAHLQQGGLGHVCEVVDGDPPHRPGGCPFQAWSVGELIRIRQMLSPRTRMEPVA